MKKIKFIKDTQEPESSSIEKYRDFDTLINSAKGFKIPIYKTPVFLSGIAASMILVGGLLIYLLVAKKESNSIVMRPFVIQPPLQEVKIPAETYIINALKGGDIITKTGAKLHIPSLAFSFSNGQAVSGEVRLNYKSYHDPVDFFLSGIPMDYDSGGVRYSFRSAGMVNIEGYFNDKRIFISKNKSITISLPSSYAGNEYNLYKLDTQKGRWLCEGRDQVMQPAAKDTLMIIPEKQTVTELEQRKKMAEQKIISINKQVPPEPLMADTKRFSLHLNVDSSEFPELSIYKNTLFEISQGEKYDPADAKIVWNDAKLSEGNKSGSYLLTLINSKRKVTYNVVPVYEGQDYIQAREKYKKKYGDYIAIVGKNRSEEEEAIRACEQQLQAAREKYRKDREESISSIPDLETRVYRVFQVNEFGIWNCDHPELYPAGSTINSAYFENEKGEPMKLKSIYLVEKGRNALMRLRDNTSITYNAKKENMLWGITEDNKLAVYPFKEFAMIPQGVGKYTFKLKVEALEPHSEADVRRIAGI